MRGLYIHIPFCIQKCKYCDFLSFTCGDKQAYIDALVCELSEHCGEMIDSVFVGGGTPTCIENPLLEKIFCAVHKSFRLAENTEWTVEANPKTLNDEKLRMLRSFGVNRLSVGVQSFDDAELRAIGRIHTAREAEQTLFAARKYFENLNIDLISALPGQSTASFRRTLSRAAEFDAAHISCYSLILEEGTPLYNENLAAPLALSDEDEERLMYDTAVNFLNNAGFSQYEISNFAKPNRECRHNLKYWHCEEYIGAGLGAHSYIDGVRFSNTRDMKSYIAGSRAGGSERLTQADMRAEFVILAMRLREGVDESEYERRFGRSFCGDYGAQLGKFTRLGMIEKTERGYRLTDGGICVSNAVLCEFV